MKPDFKEMSANILDRSDLEEALELAYNMGVEHEASRWWRELDQEVIDGYYGCYSDLKADKNG